MTEAVKRVIVFGQQTMHLYRVQAYCFLENIGSARVMEKAGMRFEGILKGFIYAKARHHDVRMYALTRI